MSNKAATYSCVFFLHPHGEEAARGSILPTSIPGDDDQAVFSGRLLAGTGEREREREMVLGVAATAAAGVSSPLQWKPRAVRSIEARGYYAFLGGGHPPSPSLSGSR